MTHEKWHPTMLYAAGTTTLFGHVHFPYGVGGFVDGLSWDCIIHMSWDSTLARRTLGS